MGMCIQIDIPNKRMTKLSKWSSYYKRCYHRALRHELITEDSIGGHVVKKYSGGWMY